MELNELYKSILKFGGLTADDKGFVSTIDKKEPVFINKDRLVLPVPYQLRENTDPDRIIFHPLADNILQGESKVIAKLKHNINVRLNQAIALLGQYLLTIASTTDVHPSLNPEQLRYITAIKEINDEVAVKWGNFAAALMKEAPDRSYVNIFLCRGGTIGTTKYSRVGVTSFPLYEKLIKVDSDENKALKIREMDKLPFRQVLEVMFDDIDVAQKYDVGSHSNFAPYLQAMMLTAAGIASRLNTVLRIFRHAIPDDEATVFIAQFTGDLDWLHDMTNMDDLGIEIRKVPPQKDGSVGVTAAPAPVVNNSPVPNAVAPVAPPIAAPQMMPAPAAAAPAKTANGLSIKGFLAGSQQQQQQQMQQINGGQVVMQQVVGPNGQVMLVPVQQMQQIPQQMNPWQLQQLQQQMQQMQPAVPTWAQVPAQQVMVNTPQGVMNQAAAMQLGLPYQPLPAQNMAGMNGGRPGWA